MTVREFQNKCIKSLKEAGCPCPEDEAEKIMLSAWEKDRLWLFTSQRLKAGAEELERAERLLSERLSGRPLQYVLGRAYFMDLELFVDERVLIPRQDTELIAETAAEWIKMRFGSGLSSSGAQASEDADSSGNSSSGISEAAAEKASESPDPEERKAAPKALDLCTGSGALAVFLKHSFPRLDVTASDISPEALEISGLNANKYDCYITFVLADLFEDPGEDLLSGPFDLIVSNPPYIPTGDIPGLMADVRDHEPSLALDGGEDGLDIVRRIISEAPARLSPGGLLLIEMGEGQEEAVISLAKECGAYDETEVLKDLNGHPRMLRCLRR